MEDPFSTSLVVTAIGMVLLFAALALLCGLMYLMTAFIKDRPPAPAPGAPEEKEGQPAQEDRLRAAMIAVALARAEAELITVGAPEPESVTAWRRLHHQRQLTRNLRPRRPR